MSHRPQLALLLLTGMTLVVSACTSKPDLDITIHQSERGAVFVERIPDRSFQATHPMTLSSDTMARVLRGVILKDVRGVLGSLASDKTETIRVFDDMKADLLVRRSSGEPFDKEWRQVLNVVIPKHSNGLGLV